jgi:ABC-2 type transport system ATP-binding protein
MIRIENITRKYGDFTAVDDVSFSISKGEIVGLLGHNGAGKTTIMKMLTGYLEPTSGNIFIDGIPMHKNRNRAQERIGYLPENCPVYPEMTIIGYLDYSASLHGVRDKERPRLIGEAIMRTALKEKATKVISTLSRGYRQRTGVAQAILHKPDILILDEPTNGLDPTQIQQMRSLITGLAENSTVIISTHILQEVQAICDRAIIIKDGRIALDASLSELNKKNRLLITTSGGLNEAEHLFKTLHSVNSATLLETDSTGMPAHTFALTLAETTDRDTAASSIAKSIHEHGWDLYTMHFETRNLETVFSEISG